MNINGKDVSLRFGMLSVEIFLGEAAKFDGLSYYTSYAMAKVIYAGMVNYYEVKGLKHPLTFEEIYDYVENSMLTKVDITDDVQELSDAIKKKQADGMKQELQLMQQG